MAGHRWHGLYSLTGKSDKDGQVSASKTSGGISTVLVDGAQSPVCDPSIQTQSEMQTPTVGDGYSAALRHAESSGKGNEGCFVQAHEVHLSGKRDGSRSKGHLEAAV